MTTISEPDIPAIEVGEQEKAPGKPSRAKTIAAIAAGAALITAINVTAAVYLYRGVAELRSMEARLGQLGQFEQRISARIDTVNNGFQSRFETLDRQLQASFGRINGNLARMEQTQPAADADVPAAPEPPALTGAVTEAPTVAENTVEPGDTPRPFKRKAAAPPPGPNPSYQRIEQSDGKVYYKKIN
ncbi:hypothetical protein [Mesorhizobium sp. B1-1-8]|uniref:hypothetical protein n=1 Tax=Mesorhizobium sp. B1-1-8 TaxID=2589976 RepID=UPI00112B367D|nr:hypothetical protein [Mesorhizobium sp. B1-1-8]UCI07307.1 hypothetical protein FJ974_26560 [Mesorhizobium sp. B1-1-8]